MMSSALVVLEALLQEAHEYCENEICYDLDLAREEDELEELVNYFAQPKKIGAKKYKDYIKFLTELKEEESNLSRRKAITVCEVALTDIYYSFIRE